MNLDQLITRLSEAVGSNYALECDIAEAVGLVTEIDRGSLFDTVALYGGRTTPLSYTSSIDSALTLVPEGWGYLVGRMGDVNQATLLNGANRIVSCFDGVLDDLEPATPAIALVIAALRARQSLTP